MEQHYFHLERHSYAARVLHDVLDFLRVEGLSTMTRLLAGMAIGTCLLGSTPAMGQGDTEPLFLDATTNVPPDFEDVLYADCQEWVALFWLWYETGVVTPEMDAFEFTYPEHLPKGWTPFGEAYDLFEQIHMDKLQLDPDAGELYYLDDLLDDDANVRAQFKTYTLTGILTTSIGDTTATTNHIGIIMNANDEIQMVTENVWIEQTDLASQGQLLFAIDTDEPEGTHPVDCTVAPEACEFRDQLEDWLYESDIDRITYRKDGWWTPGFDCDDYSEAFWAWLKHQQDAGVVPADVDISTLWLYWKYSWGIFHGTKHGKMGHAVIIVRYNGYYYIVDPQAGIVSGPYPESTSPKDIDWGPIFDPTPNDPSDDVFPPDNPDTIKEKHPTDRPWNDPAPWHSNPDRRDDVEDETGNPPDDYIYP